MWIIAGNAVMGLPDDAPVPPGCKRIALPEDFHEEPGRYRIEDDRLELDPDYREPSPRVPPLTGEEILALRELLEKART